MQGCFGLGFVALAAYAAHAGLGFGGAGARALFEDWIYNAVLVLAAALAIARGVVRREERTAWLTLGFGLAAWSAGTLHSTLAGPPSATFPTLDDVLWLALYPASYAGLVLLVRARVRQFHPVLWLDGLIGALAVAGAGAAIVLPAVLAHSSTPASVAFSDLLYPIGDLVLLGLVAGVFALTAWRPGRAWALLLAGFAVGALADCAFVYENALGTYAPGGVQDALWPASALLLAAAAWQPVRPRAIRLVGWRILVLPSAFALVALTILVWNGFAPLGRLAVALAALTILVVILRAALTFAENLRMLARSREEALTDSLTRLGNRRRFMDDLPDALERATPSRPCLLALYDLDGFKRYNDAFGHPAGDALLARLGESLAASVAPHGSAYRLGGDEFCVLVQASSAEADRVAAAGRDALTDHGRGFTVDASCGTVRLPAEAEDEGLAMSLADRRLYADKDVRRRAASGAVTRDVLLQVLREREPDLCAHVEGVTQLAGSVGRRLGLGAEALDVIARAAELHDVGKMAVPDSVLHKPGPLDAAEREFILEHTIIGERILNASPAMRPVARVVRASHERWDGTGYPDRLAGEEIPLEARIVAVCDAFHTIISERSYQGARSRDEALAELERCAGSQFDPRVVAAFREAAEATFVRSAPPVLDRVEDAADTSPTSPARPPGPGKDVVS